MRNPQTYKRLGILFFGFFACVLIVIQSLGLAANKDFSSYEVFRLFDTLSANSTRLIMKGAGTTPSPNPLYYVLEHKFVRHALVREKSNDRGFDWRVSTRAVSALMLGLGVGLAFLVLLLVNKPVACLFAAFMGTSNFALAWGGQNDIFGTWLGLSAFFYGATLALALIPSRFVNALWVASALALSFTSITSPVQIVLAVFLIIMINIDPYSRKTTVEKFYLKSMTAVSILSILISIYYKTATGLSFSYLVHNISLAHFFGEGMAALGGARHTFDFFLASVALIAIALRVTSAGHRKLYAMVGILGLTQWMGYFADDLGLLLCGVTLTARHGIFLIATEQLVYAALIAFILEIALDFYPHFLQQSQERRDWVFVGVVALACLNWFAGPVRTLPDAFMKITAARTPYCPGVVLVPFSEGGAPLSPDRLPLIEFNKLNELRHANRCGAVDPTKGGVYFDFNPPWIYGDHVLTANEWTPLR